MKRELLEKPFEPGQIRQRKGRNGLLDYVEGWSVIQRLNDALEGEWSFEIVHHEIREEEVLVLGRLAAGGIVKMNFGTSQVTREKERGQALSLGDDLKAAATDSLKKCATFLGVGLHLYAEKPLAGRAPAPRAGVAAVRPAGAAPARAAVPAPAAGGNGGDGVVGRVPAAPAEPPGLPPASRNGAAGGNGAITERQLDAITSIAAAKGLRPADIDEISLRTFRRKPGELTRAEASSLIKELSNRKRESA